MYHDKRSRNVFSDLKKEVNGIIMNEVLWRIVDSPSIEGKTYWDSYNSLILNLKEQVSKLEDKLHRKFWATQTEKMSLWLEVIDKVA